jgi:membrane protease YdiL (CAAX protease family)
MPSLLRGEAIPKFTGLTMFPLMILGPSVTGLLLTRVVDGRRGQRELFSAMGRGFAARWYAALLIPPAAILTVLFTMEAVVSPVYRPNVFAAGILFGVPAGLLEEIGWMGYAFPKMSAKWGALAASVLLGLLWGLWHVPAMDFLGTSTPHGSYWLAYSLAFTAAMTPMRVVIAWMFVNTRSVLLAQLMHASSTGFLVMLSPAGVTAGQEVLWYFVYAGLLWLVVGGIVLRSGTGLMRENGAV